MMLGSCMLVLAAGAVTVPDGPVAEWTQTQVDAFLSESPWAVTQEAYVESVGRDMTLLPPEHPFYDPLTADMLAWAPGKAAVPGLGAVEPAQRQPTGRQEPYQIQWKSARIVRDALLRQAHLAGDVPEGLEDELRVDDDLRYEIRIAGAGLKQLDRVSWDQFVSNVSLTASDGGSFPLVNVRTPRDLGRGAEAIFVFDRINAAAPITAKTEHVTFSARLGGAQFEATFAPPDMVVAGKPDLVGPVTTDPQANPLRTFELVLFRGIDRDFRRALRRVEVRPAKDHPAGTVILVYDAALDDPPDGSRFEDRMFEAALRAGQSPVLPDQLWFVDVKSDRQAWLRGADCKQLASVSPRSARVLFDGVAQKPQKKK